MTVIHRFGNLRGTKEKYKQNVWYSIWHPFPGLDENDDVLEESGLCFGFAEEDIDDAIALLQHLKTFNINDYTEQDDGKREV